MRLVPASYESLNGVGPSTPSPSKSVNDDTLYGFKAKFTAHFDPVPKPFVDGDCRLQAPRANMLFTNPSGSIVFDSMDWMNNMAKVNTSLGWQVNATRIRWMIRPSQPTKQISITFDSLDLSQSQLEDMLYVMEDCNRFVDRTWVLDYEFDIMERAGEGVHILNGFGADFDFYYGSIEVPCPLTFESSCIVIELDMAMRFPDPERFKSMYTGFSMTYTSSNTAPKPGVAVKWQLGGPQKACMPAYIKEQSPPKFVWNELCCQDELGNDVFGPVNFWGNLSIDPLIPPGEDEENFKVIYKVEPYTGAASTLGTEVTCDSNPNYLQNLPGWYPSGPRMVYPFWSSEGVDALWAIENWAEYNKDKPIPEDWMPPASNSSVRLLYLSNKVATINGRQEIINITNILLNPHKPSSDRPELPSMHDHVLISAVTCRKYVSRGQTIWQKSGVAQMDVAFATGPSISMAMSLPEIPNSLLHYDPKATESQQIAAAKPLMDALVDTLSSVLGIENELSVGALSRIAAIDFAASESSTPSRRNFKATQVSKPGYQATRAPALEEGPELLYDVNITLSILCKSIQQVTQFRRMLSSPAASRRFASMSIPTAAPSPSTLADADSPVAATSRRVSLGRSLSFAVQVPTAKQVGRGGACLSHYDCTQSPTPLFCSKNKVCEVCRLCNIDQLDAIDGKCPRELCPLSGGFPECVSAPKLTAAAQPCKKTYNFEVWRYTQAQNGNLTAPEVSTNVFCHYMWLMLLCLMFDAACVSIIETRVSTKGILDIYVHVTLNYYSFRRIQVKPPPKPKAKFVTPYNRLVGAVMVTQTRRKQGLCQVSNPHLKNYVQASGTTCQVAQVRTLMCICPCVFVRDVYVCHVSGDLSMAVQIQVRFSCTCKSSVRLYIGHDRICMSACQAAPVRVMHGTSCA